MGNSSTGAVRSAGVAALLKHPSLWRTRHLPRQREGAGHATGFPALDAALHDGGWPAAGLLELLIGAPGIGELRLLLPALAGLSRNEARWIIWVAPPFLPYAPALANAGVALDKVLLVHPPRGEALWAAERALKSGAASAVLAWLPEAALGTSALRRLQLAAQTGRAWTTLFRPASAARQPSMAELRIRVESEPSALGNRLGLSILKRRGGWAAPRMSLTLKHAPLRHAPEHIARQLAHWRGNGLEPAPEPAGRERSAATALFRPKPPRK